MRKVPIMTTVPRFPGTHCIHSPRCNLRDLSSVKIWLSGLVSPRSRPCGKGVSARPPQLTPWGVGKRQRIREGLLWGSYCYCAVTGAQPCWEHWEQCGEGAGMWVHCLPGCHWPRAAACWGGDCPPGTQLVLLPGGTRLAIPKTPASSRENG